jgi:beta-N-acetylhexosaminidase
MGAAAAIYGLAGPELNDAERAFFRSAQPWGFILFQRNCVSRAQVRRLTDELRTLSGRADVPILIDEEGGRVQRLKPPEWPARPAMGVFGALYEKDPARGIEAARLNAALIAADLAQIGVNVDCIPCIDVPVPGAHGIIGDRAFGTDPELVATLGREVGEALIAAGVLPVIKHVPGHGRATADSHLALPRVGVSHEDLARTDFLPFHRLASFPLAMTAHVVFEAIDAERCATLSVKLVQDVIRGEIGFDGLLMSDDLSMKALAGGFAERASGALAAGCDVVLHCNGNMAEMEAIAGAVPPLSGKPLVRAEAALGWLGRPHPAVAVAGAQTRLKELLS